MVNLKYIRRRQARRIIAAVAGGCAAVALVIGAIALFGQRSSPLTVSLNNSGAKLAQVIKVLGGSHRRYAGIGDIVVVAIKEAIPTSTIKEGSVQKGDEEDNLCRCLVMQLTLQVSQGGGDIQVFCILLYR